jgi:L-asparagine transporter-like permease
MMSMIADDGDAPKLFTKRTRKRHFPYAALGLTIAGLIASIVVALLMPKGVYEYIITAGGLMLLYTWLFILFASRKLLRLTKWGHIKSISALVLILIAISGTVFDHTSRPGLFVSLAFLSIIGAVTFFIRKRWKAKKIVAQ